MSSIDIKGLDKKEILKAMWENMKPASFYTFQNLSPPEYAAPTHPLEYLDYYRGRRIKTDFSGDALDPRLYDRDAGSGALAKIVEKIRNKN